MRRLNFPLILREILESDLLMPVVLILSYVIFIFVARGVLPTSDELIVSFEQAYASYGYQIIFFSALLESLILVNLVVPGGAALALGAVFARSGQTDLVTVIAIASAGVVCGYMLDYLLGKYGFGQVIKKTSYGSFLDQAKLKLKRYGNRSLIVSFVHSNIGSFTSFAAGILKFNIWKFFILATVATVVWATFWALIIYTLGDIFLEILKRYGFLLVILILGFAILSKIWGRRGKGS